MRASARGFGLAVLAAGLLPVPVQGLSLRFYGNGVDDIDRVKIRVDDPATSLPGPPADIGATDFTLEFWMKADAADNPAGAVACGFDIAWIYGHIVFDRDRYNQDRKFGLSVAGGRFVFGVSGDGTGDRTICGTVGVLDGQWHHVAVERRRSDGWMWLFVDGALQAQADGPDGDVSYPDAGVPGSYCGGPCTNSDPFLVIAAEKHDAGSAFPSYSGLVDEVRLPTSAPRTPPACRWTTRPRPGSASSPTPEAARRPFPAASARCPRGRAGRSRRPSPSPPDTPVPTRS
jgi:hypothetical protein